jgi:hypothetical protein
MNKAADLLGRVARKLNHPNAPLAWLSSSWPQIVGKTLAVHTHPLRCEAGRLEIAADAKGWQPQLDRMTADFCARINDAWGSTLIREVKFVARKHVPPPASACEPASPSRPLATSNKELLRIPALPSTSTNSPAPPARFTRLPYELDNDHTPFIRRRKT